MTLGVGGNCESFGVTMVTWLCQTLSPIAKELSLETSEQFSRNLVAALKRVREDKAMSQSQLARLSGVSRAMVNHLESGKRNPSVIVAHALATALGVNLADMMPRVQM